MDEHWIKAAHSQQRLVGVIVGAIPAMINPLEAAPLMRPAQVKEPGDTEGTWWLNVYMTRTLPPLPQIYRADEILGFWPTEILP